MICFVVRTASVELVRALIEHRCVLVRFWLTKETFHAEGAETLVVLAQTVIRLGVKAINPLAGEGVVLFV